LIDFRRGIDMKLRRLEFVVIGVTLAFACFMGGFFTGRSWSAVNIVAVATDVGNESGAGEPVRSTEETLPAAAPQSDIVDTVTDDTMGLPGDPGPAGSSDTAGLPKAGDGKININKASKSELMDLPGIGTVLASRIVDYRDRHGDFSRIEDIRNVSGIGEKRFEAIQDKITVG